MGGCGGRRGIEALPGGRGRIEPTDKKLSAARTGRQALLPSARTTQAAPSCAREQHPSHGNSAPGARPCCPRSAPQRSRHRPSAGPGLRGWVGRHGGRGARSARALLRPALLVSTPSRCGAGPAGRAGGTQGAYPSASPFGKGPCCATQLRLPPAPSPGGRRPAAAGAGAQAGGRAPAALALRAGRREVGVAAHQAAQLRLQRRQQAPRLAAEPLRLVHLRAGGEDGNAGKQE